MARPFEELRDGLPLWRLQVENPGTALDGRAELVWKALDFPQGGVLGLAVKLYDTPGRPAIHHHAVAFGSGALQALQQAQAVRLVYERQGWIKNMEKTLPLDLGSLPSLPPGQEALAPYVEAYQRELPKAGSPEAAWDAMEQSLRQPVAAPVGVPAWLKVLLSLLAAGLTAALAWFLFHA